MLPAANDAFAEPAGGRNQVVIKSARDDGRSGMRPRRPFGITGTNATQEIWPHRRRPLAACCDHAGPNIVNRNPVQVVAFRDRASLASLWP